MLFNEQLSISRAMSPCAGTAADTLELERASEQSLDSVIREHHDAFFGFAQRHALHVRHFGENRENRHHSRTVVTLPPRCFTVDFNEDFVKITALK